MEHLGKMLVSFSAFICVIGLVLWLLADKVPVSWFGRLPGDVRIERPGFQLCAPLTTMILLSLGMSAVLWLFNKFFR